MRPVNNVYGGGVGRSRLLEKLLRDSGRANNGTTAGGLAHALQSGMAGYLQGQERQAEQKAIADEGAAMNAMNRGMSAQQWQPPEGEALYAGADGPQISREQFMEQQPQAGGYGGAITALQGLGPDNQAAGRLTSQLTMKKMDRDQSRADLMDERQYQTGIREEDRAREIEMFNLEQEAANRRLTQEQANRLAALHEQARLAAANSKPAPYLSGTSLPAQYQSQLFAPNADPSTPEYANAYYNYAQGETKVSPDGTRIVTKPDMRAIPVPTWNPQTAQGAGQPQPTQPMYGAEGGTSIDQIETPEQAAARVNSLESVNSSIATIDSLLNDPDLDSALGMFDSNTPAMPGGGKARVRGKMSQLQGQNFLQAYQSLKGGGTITEVEGAKAEAALSRLSDDLSEEDYREAAKELRSVFARNQQRLNGVPESDLPPIYVPKNSRPQGQPPVSNGGGQMDRNVGSGEWSIQRVE